MLKPLAYRLYLSAQVLVTAISVLFVLWWGVTQVHDRQVAAADFACYDREAISFQGALHQGEQYPWHGSEWEEIRDGKPVPEPAWWGRRAGCRREVPR